MPYQEGCSFRCCAFFIPTSGWVRKPNTPFHVMPFSAYLIRFVCAWPMEDASCHKSCFHFGGIFPSHRQFSSTPICICMSIYTSVFQVNKRSNQSATALVKSTHFVQVMPRGL